MSSRFRDRAGAGAGASASASKILSSNPHKPLVPTAGAGKENPRSLSRGRASAPEKPAPVIVPRSVSRGRASAPITGKENPRSISRGRASVEKPPPLQSAVRWSTSSMPVRGKLPTNTNPPGITERKGRVDAGTKARDEKLLKGVQALENRKLGQQSARSGSLDASRKSARCGVRSENSNEKLVNSKTTLEILKVKAEGDAILISQPEERKMASNQSMPEADDPLHAELKEKVSDTIVSEQKPVDDAEGSRKKYTSKLHEKLAMLEGKVQRIASEIKQTKQMLDQNNPVESKLILTDIQNKISGIEKAVGNAIEGSNLGSDSADTAKVDSKIATKGLNYEELEARFFPHHKLIRNQTSIGPSGENDGSGTLKHDKISAVKDVSDIPIDENPVALEFLASLDVQTAIKRNFGTQFVNAAVRELGMERISASQRITNRTTGGNKKEEIALIANETLDDFEDQENQPAMELDEMTDESFGDPLVQIGRKSSTCGWFVSEGDAVLLAHDDGTCSYYDMANLEVKAEYKPPTLVSNNIWADCWLIRAPGVDGCSGRYVVAASAGNSQDSGFCSWDFYTKDVKAFRVEDEAPSAVLSSVSRTALAHVSNSDLNRRRAASTIQTVESPQWWYRPCGPLLVSTASRRKSVSAYDIRDGDLVMNWEIDSPVLGMEYSSPIQWRSRGKLIVAQTEKICLWDVNSLNPQPLVSVPLGGKKVYSLHVNNIDAELGGGVRQRVSSSEVEGNDGVFCTQDSINVFDFRLPSGVGLKISRNGGSGHTIFSREDNIYIGCTEGRLLNKTGTRSQVQHFSMRKAKLSATYLLPDLNTHSHQSSLTQVWGNSNSVMGVCGMGLFVFDAVNNDGFHSSSMDQNTVEANVGIGPDDLYFPTFDYLGSRVLVISRDRPASWKYLS